MAILLRVTYRTLCFFTGLAASMAVNTLMTGMIVFKILKATGIKPTSLERTLGSTGGGNLNNFRHIMFIIIKSGMALFAIQLVRFVIELLLPTAAWVDEPALIVASSFVVVMNQMLNVCISSIPFYFCFF